MLQLLNFSYVALRLFTLHDIEFQREKVLVSINKALNQNYSDTS